MDPSLSFTHPKEIINDVILKLSKDKTRLTIFACDELTACTRLQKSPDWANLSRAEHLDWVLSLRETFI